MVDDTKQFGESNALQRRVLKEIHCFPWFIVSLTLLYGIFLKTSFSPVIYRAWSTVQILLLVWGSLRLAPTKDIHSTQLTGCLENAKRPQEDETHSGKSFI